MFILSDPDYYETVTTSRRCPHHQRHPADHNFAGCTCNQSIGHRLRSAEEVMRIKAEKQRKREDDILREADAIRARRQFAEFGA